MTILTWLIESTLQWLACITLSLPFVALAIRAENKPRSITRPLFMLAAFFGISLALARSSSAIGLLPAPWQAMTFEAIFALCVILATRSVRTSGLSAQINRSAWRAAILVTILLLVYAILRNAGLRWLNSADDGQMPGWEYLLYLATLPGIAEELAYRGVIQPRLNQLFPSRRPMLKAGLGWGFVITAILFWGIHAFSVNGQQVSFHWQTMTLPLIAGIVLGWMRERTQSIWPGVLAHNLLNLVWILI